MPIRLICVCGRAIALPEKYAGQHVQCPDCHAMLRIPTREEDLSLIRWTCSCGQRLKARPRTVGQKLRCPKCSSEVSVPFANGHSAFVEEDYMLDDESGIVQRVPERRRGDLQPVEEAGPPVAEPPVKNLLSTSALERGGMQPPAASKADPPPGPALVPDGDDDVTTIHPRGPTFLGEMERTPAKRDTGDAFEAVTRPPAQSDRVRRQPIRPAKPAASAPQPAVAALSSEEEAYAQEVEEEGIRSPELLSYFNTKTGIEAAKAAAMQVLNGYWLYIPYALLAPCMANIAQLALGATAGNTSAAVACLALPSLFSLFLWAGFVACVKDGIFERAMGIERMFYNAGVHFLRFTLTSLMMVPVAVGLVLVGAGAVEAVWGPAPFIGRVGIVALAFAAGLFALELLLLPPVIAVLEHRTAFSSVTRGLLFGFRHFWDLITITAASMVLFWGTVGVICFLWWLSKLMLSVALPAWLFDSMEQFFGGLISAAFMGQVVASLMLLYLSHVGDEERLQQIQNRLQGPAAVPVRLYGTIGAAAVALLALNYARVDQKPAAGNQLEAPPAVREPVPESSGPQAPARP